MSDALLDPGTCLPSPPTDWSRERPFQVAFALSVVAHAILIAFIPGFRAVPPDAPAVLEVQIVPAQVTPLRRIQEQPVVEPQKAEPEIVSPLPEPTIFAPKRELVPEPVRPPEPELNIPAAPAPAQRAAQPEAIPPPRPDVIALPRVEPKPEVVAPKMQPTPESTRLPRVDATPEPKIERQPPPPVARVAPQPEPPAKTVIQPRPEPPRIEPKVVRPEANLTQELPRPIQPRAEPTLVPPDPRPVSPMANAPVPPVSIAPAPPAVVPQPAMPKVDVEAEGRLLLSFSQSISKQIKRHQKYPPPAQRRGWEGTAEVLLQIAADGNITGITLGKSSGYAILDEEALSMVRRASPLPAAPADLRGRALVVTVPIVFRLQNS